MASKQVVYNLGPGKSKPLATFTLDGTKLKAEFDDADYKADIELNGIWSVKTGRVMLKDGRKFYDALEQAYVNSSRISVMDGA